jgi:hypothetical protein
MEIISPDESRQMYEQGARSALSDRIKALEARIALLERLWAQANNRQLPVGCEADGHTWAQAGPTKFCVKCGVRK